jgi:hypothetical protein
MYRPQSTTSTSTRATREATRIIDVLIHSRVVLKAAIGAYFFRLQSCNCTEYRTARDTRHLPMKLMEIVECRWNPIPKMTGDNYAEP